MKAFQGAFPGLVVALMVLVLQANGQTQGPGQVPLTSPCTAAMLSSFNPCIGYLTNGNATGSPTTGCCASLRSLMSNGSDCLCQIVTGGVPFRIPVNRSLAISLPKVCKQSGVPVQCKASTGAPVPAPGPAAFTPSASPAAATSPSAGTAPGSTTPALGPVSDTTPDLTPTTPEASVPPTSTVGGTPGSTFTPSAAVPSLGLSPSLLLLPVAVMMMKYF